MLTNSFKNSLAITLFSCLFFTPAYTQSYAALLQKINNKIAFQHYREAIVDLDKLILDGVDKDNLSTALFYRGKAKEGIKLHKDAVVDYNAAIKADKNNVEAINYRGISYFEMQQYAEALKNFEESLKKK